MQSKREALRTQPATHVGREGLAGSSSLKADSLTVGNRPIDELWIQMTAAKGLYAVAAHYRSTSTRQDFLSFGRVESRGVCWEYAVEVG